MAEFGTGKIEETNAVGRPLFEGLQDVDGTLIPTFSVVRDNAGNIIVVYDDKYDPESEVLCKLAD